MENRTSEEWRSVLDCHAMSSQFIAPYMNEIIRSTEIHPNFALWSALALLSSAAGRHYHTALVNDNDVRDHKYGNLFIIMTSAVTSGRSSAVNEARYHVPTDILLADPNNFDDFRVRIKEASRRSIGVYVPEIKYLFDGTKTRDSLKVQMIDGFDCRGTARRHAETLFHDVCLTFLAASHVNELHEIFEGEWNHGITARSIMVWGDGLNIHSHHVRDPQKSDMLRDWLNNLYIGARNQFVPFSLDARKFFIDLRIEKLKRTPPHTFMDSYWHSRYLLVMKLSMLSALDSGRLEISVDDVKRANMWLEGTEDNLDKIFQHIPNNPFRAAQMAVIRWMKDFGKPVPEHDIKRRLGNQVSSDKVEKVFMDMLSCNMIERTEIDTAISANFFRAV